MPGIACAMRATAVIGCNTRGKMPWGRPSYHNRRGFPRGARRAAARAGNSRTPRICPGLPGRPRADLGRLRLRPRPPIQDAGRDGLQQAFHQSAAFAALLGRGRARGDGGGDCRERVPDMVRPLDRGELKLDRAAAACRQEVPEAEPQRRGIVAQRQLDRLSRQRLRPPSSSNSAIRVLRFFDPGARPFGFPDWPLRKGRPRTGLAAASAVFCKESTAIGMFAFRFATTEGDLSDHKISCDHGNFSVAAFAWGLVQRAQDGAVEPNELTMIWL